MNRIALCLALAISVAITGTAEARHKQHMQAAPRHKADFEGDRPVPAKCCIQDADTDGDGVSDRLDRCPNTPAGCKVDDYGCPWDSDQDGVCDGLDECPNTPQGQEVDEHGCDAAQNAARHAPHAQAESKAAPPPPPLPPPSQPQNEVEKKLLANGEIRLENVYFESGKAKLLPESEQSLNQAGEALEKFPGLGIEVQGHTDSRGPADYNMKLSQARAETVREYLITHYHLDAGNLKAKGYGESRPEVKEKNEEDRQRNRRVVLKVLNPQALPKGVEIKH